ncbi:MAG: aminotransferase class I/II-fold pyridoxal phosphate-dependent enzyme [Bacteroidetes bacterium]|nr:aminotransferase class I/II-fold pyridoxal phosphate-dependent enzyme [Bacteroidota bacterium]
MHAEFIDLRSDTVTRPTKEMLDAMMHAELGDDVFGEDPTVIALEEKAARLFGKEAGIFAPSGTMTNQMAVKLHTQPGDEVICDITSHVYNYEGGGIAYNSGCSVRLIDGDRGRFTAQDALNNINPPNDHYPHTSLVTIENTSNRGGGSYYALKEIEKIRMVCRENNLKFHLDGARIFNALAETGDKPESIGQYFDTISFCLSKGLGAPVGSILLGSKEVIKKARRIRKVMGGGMRQAGILAAAGIYALDHHITRLKEDHRRAKALGEAIKNIPVVEEILHVETNIIIFRLRKPYTSQEFVNKLMERKIKFIATGPFSVRAVTHLDFDDEMLERTVRVLKKLY